jgi:hypothetical protein
MSSIKTGNLVHDTTVNVAEGSRQNAVMTATTQAAAKAADIAFYRAARQSCITNNNSSGISPFIQALHSLGTGGQ